MKSPITALNVGLLCALAVLAPAAPASANVSTYTDVDSCEGEDNGMDRFYFACEGPHGQRAFLEYAEGEAVIVYPSADGSDILVPFLVGGEGRVFGKKLEWRSATTESAPCAAILRVSTRLGSRLVVSDLDGAGEAPAFVATNEQAHSVADALCRGEAPERMLRTPLNVVTLPDALAGRYAPEAGCGGEEYLELSTDSVRLHASGALIRFHGLDVSYTFSLNYDIALFPHDASSPTSPLIFLVTEGAERVELEIVRGDEANSYRLPHFSERSLLKCP